MAASLGDLLVRALSSAAALGATMSIAVAAADSAPVFSCAPESSGPARFVAPFAVRDGIIRDVAGREVRLWGVNYYAPFSHNYQNLGEVGADYRQAIAEDVAQFQLMRLDFVRIHVFDREISDREGQLTPNRHLEVFDLLMEELDRAGIFVMLTPVAWWNTPENQSLMDRYYAYWHVGVGGSFGFSNFYGVDEMIWNEDAIRCQERYVAELLGRRSSISGRRYADFPNLVAIEPFNEPKYVTAGMLERDPKDNMHEASQSAGAARAQLRGLWNAYRGAHPGEEAKVFDGFRGELVERYLRRMFAAIDGAMGRPYLRAHSDASLGSDRIRGALGAAGVDAYTTGCYPTGGRGFESSWNDGLNFLDLVRAWNETVIGQRAEDRPRIIYEFNAPSTLQGYPYGAMAMAFAARRAQMAAMFTYTPTAVAAYNPGWRIHFLNLLHTPERAIAFAAAGEIFRRAPRDGHLPADSSRWSGEGWSVRRDPDTVVFSGDGMLIHSGNLPDNETPAAMPDVILATGSSRFVRAEGNGLYRLGRAGDGRWELRVFPNQRLVNDPFRGRSFRPMANRYMNVNEWPVVSRLLEGPRRFTFRLGDKGKTVCRLRGQGDPVQAASEGSFLLPPGTYEIGEERHGP